MDSVSTVKAEIFNHFRNHFDAATYTRPSFLPNCFQKQIGGVENQLLTGAFSEEEVKAAIWNCDSNGSSGPDGFTFASSKKHGRS